MATQLPDPIAELQRVKGQATVTSAPVVQRQATPTPTPAQPIKNVVTGGKSLINPVAQGPVSRKFFTGTGLQKAFDILSIPSYAAGGFLKGGDVKAQEQLKTNPSSFNTPGAMAERLWSGVKNIPSAVANTRGIGIEEGQGNAGMMAGIQGKGGQTAFNLGLDLALPALPFGKAVSPVQKAGRAVSKIPQVSRAITATSKFAKETPAVYKTIETVSPYFRNPEFGKMVKATREATDTRLNTLYQKVSDAAEGLSMGQRARVGQLLEGGISTGKKEGQLVAIASEFNKLADKIGKEAVDTGILSKEAYEANKGAYMAHFWKELEKKSDVFSVIRGMPNILGERFMKRGGAEGYTRDFAYSTMKGLGQEVKDVEAANFYKNVAGRFAVKEGSVPELAKRGVELAEGFAKRKGGEFLNNKLFPREVLDYLKRSQSKPGTAGKMYDTAMNFWKKGKTIWNPAYHVRNLISNQILSEMQTQIGLPATGYKYAKAVASYFGKGNQPFVDEARDVGLIGRKTFEEMVKEFKNVPQKTSKLKNLTPTNFQKFSEETAKLNVFTYLRQKGKTVQEAKDLAEEAVFSPYRLDPEELRTIGRVIPFYSFFRQAFPYTAKTFVNRPNTLAKYPKYQRAIEGLSAEEAQNEVRPDYAKDFIRTPFKNKEGNFAYYDPTYTYPFGQFAEGMEGGRLPLGLSFPYAPLSTEIGAQYYNKDPYFDQPVAKSNIPSKARIQRLQHGARTFAPSLYTTTVGKLYPAFTGQPDYAGRDRSKLMAVLDAAGIKTSIFRPEEQTMFNQMDKNNKLKSIQSEMRSAFRNQSLSPAQKQEYIKQLQQVYQETLTSKE